MRKSENGSSLCDLSQFPVRSIERCLVASNYKIEQGQHRHTESNCGTLHSSDYGLVESSKALDEIPKSKEQACNTAKRARDDQQILLVDTLNVYLTACASS